MISNRLDELLFEILIVLENVLEKRKTQKEKILIYQQECRYIRILSVFAPLVRYKIPVYNDRCNELLINEVHISFGTGYCNI